MFFIAKNNNLTHEVEEVESKDKPIYVKVDETTRNIIDKYKHLGTTISNLVKDAVEMYDEFFPCSFPFRLKRVKIIQTHFPIKH